MPIRQTIMDALVKRYGAVEGERVYYALEAEGKGPFGQKGKYRGDHVKFAAKHGLAPAPPKASAAGRANRRR